MTYITIAYRWGDLNGHWYFVYAGGDVEKAKEFAEHEREYRGGKYGCAVYEITNPTELTGDVDQKLIAYYGHSNESEPTHNHRKDMLESLGVDFLNFAEGRRYITVKENGMSVLKPIEVTPPEWVIEKVKERERFAANMQTIETEKTKRRKGDG